jgi:hypothetical protein
MNRSQMREDATVLMQAMMNPTAMQAGITGMKGMRRSYSDLLKAFGKDPDFYLEDQQVVRTPEEELMYFVGGQYVDPSMGENMDRHLQKHNEALQDPMVPLEAKKLIQKHMQATMELKRTKDMAQQMQQQGRGGPPVGQQAQNAQIGAQPQGMPSGGAPGGATSPTGGMQGPIGGQGG